MKLSIVEERLVAEHDLPADFVFYRWECFPHSHPTTLYVEFTGGRCPLMKRGERKGKPNYRKAKCRKTFVVTMEQAEKWGALK